MLKVEINKDVQSLDVCGNITEISADVSMLLKVIADNLTKSNELVGLLFKKFCREALPVMAFGTEDEKAEFIDTEKQKVLRDKGSLENIRNKFNKFIDEMEEEDKE